MLSGVQFGTLWAHYLMHVVAILLMRNSDVFEIEFLFFSPLVLLARGSAFGPAVRTSASLTGVSGFKSQLQLLSAVSTIRVAANIDSASRVPAPSGLSCLLGLHSSSVQAIIASED